MYFLVVASPYSSFQLLFRTKISVYMFADENWFQGCVSEYDSGGEEAVDDCNSNLNCYTELSANVFQPFRR
jgi:hypothetical protein